MSRSPRMFTSNLRSPSKLLTRNLTSGGRYFRYSRSSVLWPFHLPVYFVMRAGRKSSERAARVKRELLEPGMLLSEKGIQLNQQRFHANRNSYISRARTV